MNLPLRVLIVEDSEPDSRLFLRELRKGGYEPQAQRVETAAGLTAALAAQEWDVVIGDYNLPQISGLEALKLVQASGRDLPFILVSGAVGEEQAVAVMKAGAHDFLLKDRLGRLAPAVSRELSDARARRERAQAVAALKEREERLEAAHAAALNLMDDAITARRQTEQAEEKLRRLNRTLQALGRSGRTLLHATTEAACLAEVCRIIVEDCGHAMVWVGFTENDEARTVRPAACAGFEQGYLDTLHVCWADTERGRGPTGTAIRTGQVCLCRDMQTDPRFLPWRAEALKRGYRSSAALPLLIEGHAFGVLTIYSPQPDGFDEDEVRLLNELAGDFAQGIATLRLRAAHGAAEAALREREQQLQLFVDHAPAAIAMFDPQMRYIAASRRWLSDYGLSGRELAGRSHYELFPELPERWKEVHRRCLTGAVERAEEDQFVRADGRAQWIQWEIRPWHAADGAVGGIIIFSEDITERKQAEDALRQAHDELEHRVGERTAELSKINAALRSEKEFSESLIQMAPALIAVIDRKGNLIRTNTYAERLTGYPFAETKGRDMIDLFVPREHRPGLRRALLAALRDRKPRELVAPALIRDGSLRHIEWFAKPINDAAGKVFGLLAIGHDITVRKRMEEMLRRSESNLTNFFDQAPVGLAWLSPSGTILRTNRAQLEILGCSTTECLGHFFSEFCVEPARGLELLERLAAKETIRNLRLPLRSKDGRILQVLVDANSFWSEGQFQYSSIFVRDITDRVDLEREILHVGEREHRRIAQDLHDGLGQLLAGAGYLASGLRQDLAAKSLPEIRQVDRIVRAITEAIAQTRNLARGLHPVELEANGLMAALKALAAHTKSMFRIECRLTCRRPVLIKDPAVATHLYRIVQEAITNAIKHAHPGRIEICLTETPARIVLAVRDDGSGMPERLRKKLGMGLRIMRYRAGIIGGSLAFQKGPGGGTEVVCTVHRAGRVPGGAAKPASRKKH